MASRAQHRRMLLQVLRDWPHLDDNGLMRFYLRPGAPLDRAIMLSPAGLDAFIAARQWLHAQHRTTRVNTRNMTSYGLKELVEIDMRCYICNGTFIAAALAEGYTIQQYGPNAWLNITRKVA